MSVNALANHVMCSERSRCQAWADSQWEHTPGVPPESDGMALLWCPGNRGSVGGSVFSQSFQLLRAKEGEADPTPGGFKVHEALGSPRTDSGTPRPCLVDKQMNPTTPLCPSSDCDAPKPSVPLQPDQCRSRIGRSRKARSLGGHAAVSDRAPKKRESCHPRDSLHPGHPGHRIAGARLPAEMRPSAN